MGHYWNINNNATASETDPRSYEATKAVAKKVQKKKCGFNIIPL